MALILLRHTRPVGAEGRCYGVTDLLTGPDFAREVRRIEAQLPRVGSIVASPLDRSRKLAEALAAARGLKLVVDGRFRELDFGTWEGSLWDDIPRAELDAWAADLLHARPHGGETVAEMAARVGEGLAEVTPGTLVVTHMGPIRAALAAANVPGAWEARVDFGHWTDVPRARGVVSPVPARSRQPVPRR